MFDTFLPEGARPPRLPDEPQVGHDLDEAALEALGHSHRAWIVDCLRMEGAYLDRRRREGADLVCNHHGLRAPIVHASKCPAVAHLLDRCQVWSEYARAWEDFLRGRTSVVAPAPKMVAMASAAEIVAYSGRHYLRCRRCAPDIHARAASRPAEVALRAGSLDVRHIGVHLQAASGLDLGEILGVRHVVQVTTTTGEHVLAVDEPMVYRRDGGRSAHA